MRLQTDIFSGLLFTLFALVISIPVSGHQNQTQSGNVYLIIVSENFLTSPSLLSFKSFREHDFTVQIVASSAIGTTKDDYRNYIRNLMPAYVLLVGKYGDFPFHAIPYASEVKSYNYYVASSASGHPVPDIPLGLFFADNETELANIVNKTISYENYFRNYPNEYYAHAGSNEAVPPWPVDFNEDILTEMQTRYFNSGGYNFTLATANDSTPNDAWTDINMINSGIRYMIYHGHGNINKWSFGLGTEGLTQLNNTVYPVIFSFACLTGSFSGNAGGETGDCFAQKITSSEHGAVAYLGAYNISGRGMNQLLEGAVNGLFNDSIAPRLGDVLIHAYANSNNTNTVNLYYPTVTTAERIRSAWQFHLFGDPALKIPSTTTGSNDNVIKDDEFVLYPNPTSGIVNINSGKDLAELSVYSVSGQMLIHTNYQAYIDLSAYPAGIYFISLKYEKATIYRKIIKY